MDSLPNLDTGTFRNPPSLQNLRFHRDFLLDRDDANAFRTIYRAISRQLIELTVTGFLQDSVTDMAEEQQHPAIGILQRLRLKNATRFHIALHHTFTRVANTTTIMTTHYTTYIHSRLGSPKPSTRKKFIPMTETLKSMRFGKRLLSNVERSLFP